MTKLTEFFFKNLAKIFCGDTPDYYSHITGPDLVNFFNDNFNYHDRYVNFPTRWKYVYNKLIELTKNNKLNAFLNIILSYKHIAKRFAISEEKAAELQPQLLQKINTMCEQENFVIQGEYGNYMLTSIDNDKIPLGKGGFANVYYKKSQQVVVKELKKELLSDSSIKSRFKREFEITKSLKGLFGIIDVYSFNETSYSYTMEKMEQSLSEYINSHPTDTQRRKIIEQILYTMSLVHNRDIIHRDLSSNNIFISNGTIKIADFGLGKNLSALHSHATEHTNQFGQFYYCAPEQAQKLKDGGKQSDVFALGKIINFIMTQDPQDFNHEFRAISQKAANDIPQNRYSDAVELCNSFTQFLRLQHEQNEIKKILEKIENERYDESTQNYIYQLPINEILLHIKKDNRKVINYISLILQDNEIYANEIIPIIYSGFREIFSRDYASYDNLAFFCNNLLSSTLSYPIREYAAKIIYIIANEINRYNIQKLIGQIIEIGELEPQLENVLQTGNPY